MWRELRFAWIGLSRDRWTAIGAIAALALAIGLLTSLSAVFYGVLIRPMPYRDPSRLVVVDAYVLGNEIDQWRAQLRGFERVSGYDREGLTVRGAGEPRFLDVAIVDTQFYDTLGAAAERGRTFTTGDRAVAVVSDRLARSISADGNVLGRALTIGDGPVTVIGVMPPVFAFPTAAVDVWVPQGTVGAISFDRAADQRRYHLMGRLRHGATLAEAVAETDRARAAIEPRARREGPGVQPLRDVIVGPVRPALIAFGAGSLLVLLIACANVASMLVGRTVARRRELAVRLALGANRGQLFVTTLAESAVIAVTAACAGIAIAAAAVHALGDWASAVLPRLTEIRLDVPTLAAVIGLAGASTLAAALPAMRAIEPAATMLRTAGGETRRGIGVRAALATFQVALSVLLLTAGVLFARTVNNLLSGDTGIDAAHAVVTQLMLSDRMNFAAGDKRAWLDGVLARVRTLPGVTSAGAGSSLPPSNGTIAMSVRFEEHGHERSVPDFTFAAVTPGYLQAIGARLVRGRYFTADDDRRGDLLVILSESGARSLLPAGAPEGRQLPIALPGLRQRGHPTVVGVVSDVKYEGLDKRPGAAAYVLWHEVPASQLYIAVRTTGDATALAPLVRSAIHAYDPLTPLLPVRPMDEVLERTIADRRLRAALGESIAGLAFAIALVGLAGGLSRIVRERRREIAIRAALGSTPRRTIGSVLSYGARVVVAGVVLGLFAAWASGNLLASFLYGIRPRDPLTLVLVAAVVTIASMAACYLPARRAAAIDPLELMRES